ncbi:MAG: polysaccharide pyruvyl transferase family protein [Alphaproteobacteria bacterium]
MANFMKPIRLFWSGGNNRMINYGDELSAVIVAALAQRQVVYTNAASADLAAIGSILHGVCRRQWRRAFYMRRQPIVLWGTGSIRSEPMIRNCALDVRAVRGPKTLRLFTSGGLKPFGDPGLLAPILLDGAAPVKKSVRWGIIPHVVDLENPLVRRLADENTHSRIIDLRNPDLISTTRQIAECDFVISSSLHGLVVADAFSVPNIRARFSDQIAGGDWKFDDYSDSIGRLDIMPADLDKNFDLQNFEDKIDIKHFQNIPALCAALEACFPDDLF